MEKSEFNDDGFAAQEEYFRDMSSGGRSTFLELEEKNVHYFHYDNCTAKVGRTKSVMTA